MFNLFISVTMTKQKYIVPTIESISTKPEGDTCGVPVFFSTAGPGVAGAKQGSIEAFDDDDVNSTFTYHNESSTNHSQWEE